MIDILVPVRGRPQNAQPLVDSIDGVTIVPHLTIFLCSRDDDEQIEACKATGKIVQLIDGGDHEYARKINAGVCLDYSDNPWVFLGADDLRFYPGWDRTALKVAAATGRPVIGTNDLGNATVMKGLHATHSLVARSYAERGTVDEPGKLLHEGYHHNYCDTEFVETAKSRNAFAFAAQSHVEHLHPFWKKGEDDEVYRLGRARYHLDGKTFRQRRRLWQ
jgi:hypothetical protein